MNRAEKILGVSGLIGSCLTLFMFPGGSVLLILSLTSLSMIYFYLGFAFLNDISFTKIFLKESYKGISALRMAGAIVSGFVFSIMLMGILYKAQMWPGATITSGFGLLGLLITGIVAGIKYLTNKTHFYEKVMRRVVIYGIIGLVSFFGSEKIFLDFKYRKYPDYVEAVKKSNREPGNRELRDKVREEREKNFSRR